MTSSGSYISMSLQRIPMKLSRFSKFDMINRCTEVTFCLYENTKNSHVDIA